jgi:hypothetical protein
VLGCAFFAGGLAHPDRDQVFNKVPMKKISWCCFPQYISIIIYAFNLFWLEFTNVGISCC